MAVAKGLLPISLGWPAGAPQDRGLFQLTQTTAQDPDGSGQAGLASRRSIHDLRFVLLSDRGPFALGGCVYISATAVRLPPICYVPPTLPPLTTSPQLRITKGPTSQSSYTLRRSAFVCFGSGVGRGGLTGATLASTLLAGASGRRRSREVRHVPPPSSGALVPRPEPFDLIVLTTP
jgi:hypothetical protein